MTTHKIKTRAAKPEKKISVWIFLAIIFVFFVVLVVFGPSASKEDNRTLFWQTIIDEELDKASKEDRLVSRMMGYFFNTLGPDANDYFVDVDGNRSTQVDWYNYASEKTGYTCTQIAPYDEKTSLSEVVRCEKDE